MKTESNIKRGHTSGRTSRRRSRSGFVPLRMHKSIAIRLLRERERESTLARVFPWWRGTAEELAEALDCDPREWMDEFNDESKREVYVMFQKIGLERNMMFSDGVDHVYVTAERCGRPVEARLYKCRSPEDEGTSDWHIYVDRSEVYHVVGEDIRINQESSDEDDEIAEGFYKGLCDIEDREFWDLFAFEEEDDQGEVDHAADSPSMT